MIRCVVVDDEMGAIDILTDYIAKVPELVHVKSFQDSLEALNYLNHNPVDLLFLDIDMPNLNGMKVSELIRAQPVMVIFCTAYSEYAAESYERDALDYLLKPIPFDRFLRAVTKASDKIGTAGHATSVNSEAAERIFVRSGNRIHQIVLAQLFFMKKEGHYIEFYSTTGTKISRMNMAELLSVLPRSNFVRIHRSYVIALDRIETIEKDFVTISRTRIPIGDSYRAEFSTRIDFSGK